jgi:hypothetical protein
MRSSHGQLRENSSYCLQTVRKRTSSNPPHACAASSSSSIALIDARRPRGCMQAGSHARISNALAIRV